MSASWLIDEGVRERLRRDCDTHGGLVHDVVLAQQAGELESDVAMRTCALELHSLKGVASVLGLHALVRVIGPLCEAMLKSTGNCKAAFWGDFDSWFQGLLACVNAGIDDGLDPEAIDGMRARQDELLSIVVDANMPPLAPSIPPQTPHPLSPSAGRRLLLVDDSATVRAALTAQLGCRGYPVRTAKSLEETARILLEFDPEIVVTDVHMPDVEGDELCRRIKAHMKRLVPVLLYSSMPEAELSQRAIHAGADGYVCKSQGVEALVVRMDELLSDEILF